MVYKIDCMYGHNLSCRMGGHYHIDSVGLH